MEGVRGIVFQQHLQTLVHSTREPTNSASSAWSLGGLDVTFDLDMRLVQMVLRCGRAFVWHLELATRDTGCDFAADVGYSVAK